MLGGVKAMSDIFWRNFERQVARCQSEHPDIYDVHYDAIAQLKAASIGTARLVVDVNARPVSVVEINGNA